jgi:Holliday junction resolvase RusA-like endonuclease
VIDDFSSAVAPGCEIEPPVFASGEEHRVWVSSVPVSEPRARSTAFVLPNGKARSRIYKPDKGPHIDARADIRAAFLPRVQPEPLNGPLAVLLIAYLPRPESHFRKDGTLRPSAPPFPETTREDVDNLAKLVYDAITSTGFWRDDRRIVHSIVAKRWAKPSPGYLIRVRHLPARGRVQAPAVHAAEAEPLPLFAVGGGAR